MSSSLLRGSGVLTGAASAPEFQLLNPAVLHGATNFTYDFYLKCLDVDAAGTWQIDDGGWEDIAGSAVTGDGDSSWVKKAVIGDGANTGLTRINRTGTGDLEYWYALSNQSGSYPTIRSAAGSISTTTEFFVETDRVYTVSSNGTHAWQFADTSAGASWTAFDEGTSKGFTFDAPASGRIRCVPTGTVDFNISSTTD